MRGGGTGNTVAVLNSAGQEQPTDESGNEILSKEELLEVSEEFDFKQFESDSHANKVRAKKDYSDKVYTYTGYIHSIEEDHVLMSGGGIELKLFLPKENLMALDTKTIVTLVGQLSNLDYEEVPSEFFPNITNTKFTASVNPAYYVTDEVTLNGTIHCNSVRDSGTIVGSVYGLPAYDIYYDADFVADLPLNGVEINLGSSREEEGLVTFEIIDPYSEDIVLHIDGQEFRNGDKVALTAKIVQGNLTTYQIENFKSLAKIESPDVTPSTEEASGETDGTDELSE